MSALGRDREIASMLDRPVWSALVSAHRALAEGSGFARRFPDDIGPFAATIDDGSRSMEDLARLLRASPTGAVSMQVGDIAVPTSVVVAETSLGVQMVAERQISPVAEDGIVRLSARDASEMLALAERTRPGPFLIRTHLLGRFIGLRRNERLIAMAGERFRQPGFTEISAVCVDAAYRGQGLATKLVALVAKAIEARGETPYLHTFADNANAIRIYERLGFRPRSFVNIARLEDASVSRTRSAEASLSGASVVSS